MQALHNSNLTWKGAKRQHANLTEGPDPGMHYHDFAVWIPWPHLLDLLIHLLRPCQS